MDCRLPVSSVHGIYQKRRLEWVAISFSRGSSWLRDWTPAGRVFTTEPPGKPSVQLSSVAQLCPTVCNPMNHSTPGLPVHHRKFLFHLVSLKLIHFICCARLSLTLCPSNHFNQLSTKVWGNSIFKLMNLYFPQKVARKEKTSLVILSMSMLNVRMTFNN